MPYQFAACQYAPAGGGASSGAYDEKTQLITA